MRRHWDALGSPVAQQILGNLSLFAFDEFPDDEAEAADPSTSTASKPFLHFLSERITRLTKHQNGATGKLLLHVSCCLTGAYDRSV